MTRPVDYWWKRVGLRAGSDVEGTDRRVREGATLSPENLWLLAASALLASIGLDQDSTAVIIGAMLISPLMGPILAVGLGAGTADRSLLLRAVRELALASVAGQLQRSHGKTRRSQDSAPRETLKKECFGGF